MDFPKKALLFVSVCSLLIQQIPATLATHGNARVFFSPAIISDAQIGDVIRVSLMMDTGGHNVNAIDLHIKFDQDKLQVVDPSIGQSVIGIWTAPPSFNNRNGEIEFQGGITPPGINARSALISTIAFRVRAPGTARLSFIDDPKLLLADGSGENILSDTNAATINIGLPAPQGPIVTSPTHPDYDTWYRNASNLALEWKNIVPVEGYSYSLSSTYDDTPDNVSEGTDDSITYTNLPDGIQYFHIKALANGIWGDATHFPIRIDANPPADFRIKFLPSSVTSSRYPIMDFRTTDSASGVDRYEIQIISFSDKRLLDLTEDGDTEGFFVEAPSRFIPYEEISLGKYDVVVRVFDNAGNFREVKDRLTIVRPGINITQEGLSIYEFLIPWSILVTLILLIVSVLAYFVLRAHKYHKDINTRIAEGVLEDPVIRKRIKDLAEMKTKYKNIKKGLTAAIIMLAFLFGGSSTMAQETRLTPPIVTNLADDITTEDTFYVGGVTDIREAEVTIHIQNELTGEVFTRITNSDARGDWLYLHLEPFIPGNYMVWAQTKIGNEISPPSPQVEFTVARTILSIGASRLSYQTLYGFLLLIFFVLSLALGGFYIYHAYHSRKKHGKLMQEVKEAEGAIKQGFATLHEDIKEELSIIHQAKLSKSLSEKEKEKEKALLKHLKEVEDFISKELRDVKLASKSNSS